MGTKYIPVVARTLFKTRFNVLDGKRLTDLFDMSILAPENLERIAKTSEAGRVNLKGLRPSVQLAVFRLIRDKKRLNEETIDKVMTEWLIKLGQTPQIPKAIIQGDF